MERWCARPYSYNHLGSTFQPLVIGPSAIPRITDVEQAKALPELALLSVAAHGREPGAEAIGIAAYLAAGALGRLDTDRGARYADVITAWLSDAARRALEEFMSLHGYEFQSEFAKRYAAEGRKEGHMDGLKEGLEEGQRKMLIKQLSVKFGELSDGILQRLQAADTEHIERWAERILVARTIDDVFAR